MSSSYGENLKLTIFGQSHSPAIGMTLEDEYGVERLRTIDTDGTERIYDLSGRRLSAPTKGINIINGKKVLK